MKPTGALPLMILAEIWRYPVKSMGGEQLSLASVRDTGVVGDRVVQVRDGKDRVLTARQFPRLLSHRATLGSHGEPLVDGRDWRSPEVAEDVRRATVPGARLVAAEPERRFDILPLLVATDGAIREFGHDRRRLRPNLVISGVEGLAERGWEGKGLVIGEVLVRLDDLRQRCVMTTYDPDTQAHDPRVLKEIFERFEGNLALNAWVERGGALEVGAAVSLT